MGNKLIDILSSGDINKLDEYIQNKLDEKADKRIEDVASDVMEATFKRVNRIRGGEVQRRKKVSTNSNFKIVDGKRVRISQSEKRNRKLAQRKAAKKRQAGQSQANKKRKLTNRKRKSMGFDK